MPEEDLLLPVGDAAARQDVGRQLELPPVAGEDADAELAHLAARVRQHRVLVVQLDAIVPARELLAHGPFHLDPGFLLRHSKLPSTARPFTRPCGRTPPLRGKPGLRTASSSR